MSRLSVKPVLRYGYFSVFQDAGRRHLGFSEYENFRGGQVTVFGSKRSATFAIVQLSHNVLFISNDMHMSTIELIVSFIYTE